LKKLPYTAITSLLSAGSARFASLLSSFGTAKLVLLRYCVVWHKLRLVRFDIARFRNKPVHSASLSKMSVIIEAFIHFCFDIDGITKVLPVSRGAFSAHENVYITEG
jgi:hypothetical protein